MSDLTPPGPPVGPGPPPVPPEPTPRQQPAFPAPPPGAAPFAPRQGEDKPLGWTGFGLALALCVPCLPLVGVVLAVIALVRRRFRPRWVAVLALVLGLAFTAAQAAYAVSAWDDFKQGFQDGMNDDLEDQTEEARRSGEPTDIAPFKLREGDCLNDPAFRRATTEVQEAETITLLPCERRHDLEVFVTIRLGGKDYPGQAAIDKRARHCATAFRTFVGRPYADSRLEFYYYFPTRQSWSMLGDRTIVCAVGHPATKTRGTLRDSRR